MDSIEDEKPSENNLHGILLAQSQRLGGATVLKNQRVNNKRRAKVDEYMVVRKPMTSNIGWFKALILWRK